MSIKLKCEHKQGRATCCRVLRSGKKTEPRSASAFSLSTLSTPLLIAVTRPSVFTFTFHSCIGEGNGNPLQCSCLEDPRDGGAWWAAVYGVTQSQTRLSNFTFTFHSCIGEGNGNPLQCSCLENPRDGGAWWAAIYGVTQSQTRLKRLSSSSSSSRWRYLWKFDIHFWILWKWFRLEI